jgi:hypothetical protein
MGSDSCREMSVISECEDRASGQGRGDCQKAVHACLSPLLKGRLPKLTSLLKADTGWRQPCKEQLVGPVWHGLARTWSALLFTHKNFPLGRLAGQRDWQGQ